MPPEDTVFGYLTRIQQLMLSPAGVVGLAILVFSAICLVRVPAFKWIWLALILYVSMYGAGEVEISSRLHNEALILPFPLSYIRLYSREMMVVMTSILLVPALSSDQGWRHRLLPLSAVLFLIFDFWMCTRLLASPESRTRAVLSAVSYVILATTFIVGVGRWLQTLEDLYSLLSTLAWTAIFFVITNIYQVLMNPAASIGRFWGFTSNPQAVGLMGAIFLIPVLLLSQRSGNSYGWRLIYRVTAAFLVLFMIWSGSRGGMLMGALGLAIYYRWRVGPLFLASATVAVVLCAALVFFPAALSNLQRFTDPTNTRAEAWQTLYDLYRTQPLFGVIYPGNGYGESYYLAALAYYGAVGFIPAFFAMIALVGEAATAFFRRRFLGPDAVIADWILATVGMIVVNSIFEASLLGVWNTLELVLYLVFAAVALFHDVMRHATSPDVASMAVGEEDLPNLGFDM
jgi:hypothetical protein